MKKESLERLRYLVESIDGTVHTAGYAERGYNEPKSGVICLGNWNKDRDWRQNIDLHTEKNGILRQLARYTTVAFEWEDEWAECCECGKLVRTKPDSYSWMRYYWDSDDGAVCGDCVTEHPEEYLRYLEDNPRSCETLGLDLEGLGYVKYGDEDEHFENGLYGGQRDDPQVIAKSLRGRGISRFIFNLDGVGQFDMDFTVWIHKDEVGKLTGTVESKGVDPAEMCKKALSNLEFPSGEGIKYAEIDCSTGTAKTRLVSNEEFINGIGK